MAIAYLRPSSVGDSDGWTLVAGASKTAAVDPGAAIPPSPSDATYINDPASNNASQSFFVATGKPYYMVSLTSITLSARAWGEWVSGTHTLSFMARFGAADGVAVTDTTGDSTWYTKTGTPGRPGGGAWTAADIANADLQWKIITGSVAFEARCAGAWFTVTYVMWAGAFAAFAASLVGAAVGLAEMPGLVRMVYAKDDVLITPDEYVQMHRELREAKNTVYCY